MANININKTELVWLDKYDEEGKLRPVEKPGPYPFQIVEAINEPRKGETKPEQGTLFKVWKGDEGHTFEEGWKNKLIWGDNKLVMASLLEKFAGKIDLIYIDPPFATGADFSLKFKANKNEQIELANYWESKNMWVKQRTIIEEKAYRDTWGKGLDSYLQMMFDRLWFMYEMLSTDGHIFVHCDWHVGHYLRLILNEIFSRDCFKSEIIWQRARTVGRVAEPQKFDMLTDSILFFSKSPESRINKQRMKRYYTIDEARAIFKWDETKGKFFKDAPVGNYSEESIRQLDQQGRIYWTSSGTPRIKTFLEYILRGKINYVIEEIEVGNIWTDLSDMMHISESEATNFPTQKPEDLIQRIIKASSNLGDLVADFFCGSGTTLAAAEKLGRRWIGCDLSRYAIHITRKRLLEIENSKDLTDEEGKRKYNQKAKPFEILNLGKYERQLWQVKTFHKKDEKQVLFEYLAFMLKLYGAEPISGFTHIHGRKGNALVYIGAVDSPVTIQEVVDAINDCKAVEQKELHILGWEWEMGLNNAIQDIAKKEKINLKLRIIPMEVLDPEAVKKGDVRFFELAHFKVDIEVKNKKVDLELRDFVIPHTDLIPDEVKDKIKKWSDWIDYWAIDFNFQNDTFNNGWTSYRTKKDRKLELKASHTYDKQVKYKVFVKVIDIFGIDTSQIFEVEVK